MIRIVIVRVHNLGQSEIGYLDVATDEASSQQDVLLGVKSIFFLNFAVCSQEGLLFMSGL